MSKIPLSFFRTKNVQNIAQDLLGKIIYVNINGNISSAIITETEAYQGPEDKASHAYKNKRTKRTDVMYNNGGCCYISSSNLQVYTNNQCGTYAQGMGWELQDINGLVLASGGINAGELWQDSTYYNYCLPINL